MKEMIFSNLKILKGRAITLPFKLWEFINKFSIDSIFSTAKTIINEKLPLYFFNLKYELADKFSVMIIAWLAGVILNKIVFIIKNIKTVQEKIKNLIKIIKRNKIEIIEFLVTIAASVIDIVLYLFIVKFINTQNNNNDSTKILVNHMTPTQIILFVYRYLKLLLFVIIKLINLLFPSIRKLVANFRLTGVKFLKKVIQILKYRLEKFLLRYLIVEEHDTIEVDYELFCKDIIIYGGAAMGLYLLVKKINIFEYFWSLLCLIVENLSNLLFPKPLKKPSPIKKTPTETWLDDIKNALFYPREALIKSYVLQVKSWASNIKRLTQGGTQLTTRPMPTTTTRPPKVKVPLWDEEPVTIFSPDGLGDRITHHVKDVPSKPVTLVESGEKKPDVVVTKPKRLRLKDPGERPVSLFGVKVEKKPTQHGTEVRKPTPGKLRPELSPYNGPALQKKINKEPIYYMPARLYRGVEPSYEMLPVFARKPKVVTLELLRRIEKEEAAAIKAHAKFTKYSDPVKAWKKMHPKDAEYKASNPPVTTAPSDKQNLQESTIKGVTRKPLPLTPFWQRFYDSGFFLLSFPFYF